MKITNKERKQLINIISDIQFGLGQIIKYVDDSQSVESAGTILESLSVLMNNINNAEEEQCDIFREMCF